MLDFIQIGVGYTSHWLLNSAPEGWACTADRQCVNRMISLTTQFIPEGQTFFTQWKSRRNKNAFQ